MILRGLLIITVLIILPLESHALSPLYSFRHLYEQTNVSPSPSPSYGGSLASGGSNFLQSCNGASRSCQLKNITACLTYSRNGPHEEICLFVQNIGENPQHVKIMILPANNTIGVIDLPSTVQLNKVNISTDVDLRSTIMLITSNGDCVIPAAAPPPENHYLKNYSYGTYITPINGAYLGILILIMGGILTFFKLRTQGRHLDGTPYQELEMGNSIDVFSLNIEENEKENWDQDWDDGWDDEKPVKSGENHVIVTQANASPTKLQHPNGRRKKWND